MEAKQTGSRTQRYPSLPLLRSVRTRTTAAAVSVLAIVLVLGATIALSYARENLALDPSADVAKQRAGVVASRLANGESGDRLLEEADESRHSEDLLQLLSPSDAVLGSSEDLEKLGPLIFDSWPQQVTLTDDEERNDFVAVTVTVPETASANAGVTVIYLYNLREAELPTQILLLVFGAGIPAVLFTVGLTTWWLTGRAMRPVDRMREEVESISAANLDTRLVHPGGRDEIARLATTMNGMLDRLQSSQLAQRRFISAASHELRSPIATIRQFAEVSESYPGKLGEERLAQLTLSEALRMQHLVESLLFLTRTDEASFRIATAAVDLDDLLMAEASRVRSTTTLSVDASLVSAAQAVGSEQLLQQVMRNLVDNAVGHASSAIAMACGQQNGWVWVTIDDDGTGIPVSERDRVFERFVRLDEARSRNTGGSGLGLAIVKEIVLAHGGSVRVDDSPLGGARFVLFLKISSADFSSASAPQ